MAPIKTKALGQSGGERGSGRLKWEPGSTCTLHGFQFSLWVGAAAAGPGSACRTAGPVSPRNTTDPGGQTDKF